MANGDASFQTNIAKIQAKVNFIVSNQIAFKNLIGDVNVTRDQNSTETMTVPSGAVVEEISSTSLPLDSYYTDPVISSNVDRKSNLAIWS